MQGALVNRFNTHLQFPRFIVINLVSFLVLLLLYFIFGDSLILIYLLSDKVFVFFRELLSVKVKRGIIEENGSVKMMGWIGVPSIHTNILP